MSENEPFDLATPIETDTVLEVRMGKMQNMDGLFESAIHKSLCDGPMKVTEMGIEGDEHDYTFHGGVDKAVHAYCSAHYPSWRSEFPEVADRFVPGGFGENLVFAQWNERNVCIGDAVSVGGGGLVLQVSLPRQPCFKLNHRFRLRNFAPNTWRLSRTGWYYRVLRPGPVSAGDEARLVRRPHPRWTVERVQEYLHRRTGDVAMNEELSGIEELGAESAGTFRGRAAKQKRAGEQKRKKGEEEEEEPWREFRLAEKKRQTPRISSFLLEALRPLQDPAEARLSPGSHVKLRLGNGLVRAYSVVSGDRNRFELGVALADAAAAGGRGGSRYLHEEARVGDVLRVGRFTTGVPHASMASSSVFVAGGVGVTAFLPLVEALRAINCSAVLHLAVRSADEVPFRERLGRLGSAVVLYHKDGGGGGAGGTRLNIGAVVRSLPWNSQLYFCGPPRMMQEAMRETRAAGIGGKDVHFEAFQADASGNPFEAVVVAAPSAAASAGRGRREVGGTDKEDEQSDSAGDGQTKRNGEGEVTLQVGPEETLLEVLQRRLGVDKVPSSCEVGNCGTCKLTVRSGRVEHRGTALLEEEKAGWMLSCVSRGIGRIVVEI